MVLYYAKYGHMRHKAVGAARCFVMPNSHRRHGQDKTVLFCPCK